MIFKNNLCFYVIDYIYIYMKLMTQLDIVIIVAFLTYVITNYRHFKLIII